MTKKSPTNPSAAARSHADDDRIDRATLKGCLGVTLLGIIAIGGTFGLVALIWSLSR